MLLAFRALACLARLRAPPHWMLAHFPIQRHQVKTAPLQWHVIIQREFLFFNDYFDGPAVDEMHTNSFLLMIQNIYCVLKRSIHL